MNRIDKSVKCLILCTICGLLMACSTDSFYKGNMRLARQDKVLVKCINHAIAASREKMADGVLRRNVCAIKLLCMGKQWTQ